MAKDEEKLISDEDLKQNVKTLLNEIFSDSVNINDLTEPFDNETDFILDILDSLSDFNPYAGFSEEQSFVLTELLEHLAE